MLKIGDFSRLTQVSIRMLRHYDEIGLLKPAHIDHETGYRYYAAAQLPRLNRILALQDLGFSLRQILDLQKRELSPDELRGMILQKQAEMEDRLRVEQERLARARARLHQIESDGGYDVVVKNVPAQWVVSVRDTISAYASVGYLFDRLFKCLAPSGIRGLPVVIWHDDSHQEAEIDAEAMIYLPDEIEAMPDVRVYQLPATTMASVVHRGAYHHLPAAYNALVRWLDASSYQITGANRELYLHYSAVSGPGEEGSVTEIQFPIIHVHS